LEPTETIINRIDLIYSPGFEVLWIASRYHDFFFLDKEICRARTYGAQVLIKRAGMSVPPEQLDAATGLALNQLLGATSNLWGVDATALHYSGGD